jgi:hypothetical protein
VSDFFSDLPQALVPVYQMDEPNQPITLYNGKITLVQKEQSLYGEGKIQVRWFPRPANHFELQNVDFPYNKLDVRHKVKVVVENIGIELDGILTNNYIGPKESWIKGELVLNGEIGDSSSLQSITFHLINFLNFLGTAISYDGKEISAGQFRQESKDWILTIHALKNTKEIFEKLRNVGGYAITHVAKLEKKVGVASDKEVKSILEKLFWYFSFLKGSHTSPYFVTGYNNNQAKVWEFWNTEVIQSSYRSASSWFPLELNGLDKELFEKYMDFVSTDTWYEVISKAINWYLASHESVSIEQSIVWSQLCIELLAWAKFVELSSYISKSGFNSLDLGNRLRLLLSTLEIPTSIPSELSELEKVAKGNGWDGPQAIAEIRNGIAHPNLRERLIKNGEQVMYEVKKLSLWYSELAILRFLDYNGDHHNFKHQGLLQKEPVPWLTR